MNKEDKIYLKQKLKPRYKKYVAVAFICLAVFLAFISTVYIVAVSSTIYRNIDEEINNTAERAIQSAQVTTSTDADGNTIYNIKRFDMIPGRQIYVIYYIDGEIYTTNDDIYMFLIPGYADYAFKQNMGTATIFDSEQFDQLKKEASDLIILEARTDKVNKILTEAVKNNNNYYYFRTITGQNTDSSSPIAYYKVLIYCNDVVRTHKTVIYSYFWCLIFDLIVIFIGSIYIAQVVMKPLEEALDKQMKFVGDASHELKTPLAIVHSNLENILASPNHTVEEESENIVSSLHEIQRLTKLTNELLELASSDNETMKINYATFNLGDTVSNTCNDFKEVALLQNRTLDYQCDNCEVMGDCDRLKQVLIILLDNALKYSDEGDSIFVNLTSNDHDCLLEVKDTGRGISDEAMKHIFERFYREDKAHSREIQGNGLGLSIALAIIDSHHGTIKVAHNEPKGTIFTITLPKKQK